MGMPLFFIIIALSQMSFLKASELDGLYQLSNQTMDVVTHMDSYPNDGKFHLTTAQADLVKEIGINDHMIGEFTAAKMTQAEIDCLPKSEKGINLSKEYGSRSNRITAISITSNYVASKKNEQDFYYFSEYTKYMKEKGYTTLGNSYFSWDSLMSRFKGYDPKVSASVNAEKLAKYLKNTAGLVVPKEILASEFLYKELVSNPANWRAILNKSKGVLDFQTEVRLVARLGGKFQENYDKERIKTVQGGVVPLDKLLKSISTSEYAGVCRDIALGQAQMLNELGIKDVYVVGYVSNNGMHSTVIAVDPNDPDKIVKMNYGQLFEDDGKKGVIALEQDNSLPNMGLNYRIYDRNGKPVTILRSELGSIVNEMTKQDLDRRVSSKSYSLNAVSYGNDEISGSVFYGKTSSGEKITGVSVYGDASSERITAKGSLATYKTEADKIYYDLGANSIYLQGRVGAKSKIYEGKYGNFSTEVGADIEVIHINSKSTSNITEDSFTKTAMDGNAKLYSKLQYDVELSKKDKITLEAQSNWRLDQGSVADAKSLGMRYDTTTLISTYDHRFTEELATSIEVATTLSEYGENVSFMTGLKQGKNKYSVGASAPTNSDAPSFLPGQQESIKAAFERDTDEWNFKLIYEENLDSGGKSVSGSASKKF